MIRREGNFAHAPVLRLEETDSTNTQLKKLAVEGAAEGTALIAARQTGGRGRMDRRFASPEGGVYMSLLLRPDCSAEESLSITPCAAVAAARAVKGLCGLDCDIKWPNDLLFQGKKLCGILCESVFVMQRQYLVLGLGLNVRRPAEGFPRELENIAASLSDFTEQSPTLEAAAEALLRELDGMYTLWKSDRACFLEEYRRGCMNLGRRVQLIRNGESRCARALDIDDSYALVVEYSDGSREKISYGEVSLR